MTLINIKHHSALPGLDLDTHTQYLLANGSRTLTGAMNMGNQELTNVKLKDAVMFKGALQIIDASDSQKFVFTNDAAGFSFTTAAGIGNNILNIKSGTIAATARFRLDGSLLLSHGGVIGAVGTTDLMGLDGTNGILFVNGDLNVGGGDFVVDVDINTVTVNGFMKVVDNSAGTTIADAVGLHILQSGAGDAVIHYEIDGVQEWHVGIDQDNLNSYSISTGTDLSASSLLNVSTTGNLRLNSKGLVGGGKFTTLAKVESDTVVEIFTANLDRGNGVGGVGLGLQYGFSIENSAGSRRVASDFQVIWEDPTNTQEDAKFVFRVKSAGSLITPLVISGADACVKIGDGVNEIQVSKAGNLIFAGTARFQLPNVTDAGPMTATNGTKSELVYNTSDDKAYVCTITGTPATWVSLN